MSDDLVKILKDNISKLEFNSFRHFKRCSVTNNDFNKYSIKFKITQEELNTFSNLDRILNQEIETKLMSQIFSEIIINKSSEKYLDVTSGSVKLSGSNYCFGQRHSDFVVNSLILQNCKSVITNSRIVYEYLNRSKRYSESINNDENRTIIFNHGKIDSRVDVFLSHVLSTHDEYIFCFDEIIFDVFDINSYIRQEFYLDNVEINLIFKIYLRVLNPKIVYVVDDISSKHYGFIKIENRENKIDEILNYDTRVK